MRTIDKIITKVNTTFGAPMGRGNKGTRPTTNNRIFKKNQITLFDCAVPMIEHGAYDRGGAYWGIGTQLRVCYTKDLTYIEFYRL